MIPVACKAQNNMSIDYATICIHDRVEGYEEPLRHGVEIHSLLGGSIFLYHRIKKKKITIKILLLLLLDRHVKGRILFFGGPYSLLAIRSKIFCLLLGLLSSMFAKRREGFVLGTILGSRMRRFLGSKQVCKLFFYFSNMYTAEERRLYLFLLIASSFCFIFVCPIPRLLAAPLIPSCYVIMFTPPKDCLSYHHRLEISSFVRSPHVISRVSFPSFEHAHYCRIILTSHSAKSLMF